MGSERDMRDYLKAAVILGHGSRVRGFGTAMEKAARDLSRKGLFDFVLCAYLGIVSPSLPEAIDDCVRKGAREVRVLPYFLQMGKHVRKHIPQMVSRARKKYKGRARIRLCGYLGYDERIVDVVRDRLCRSFIAG